MPPNQIYTQFIHEDFMNITTRLDNESEPLWTPEKGYKNENVEYPHRAAKAYYQVFSPRMSKAEKENVCNFKNYKVYIHKPNEILTPYHESIFVNYDEFITFSIVITSHRTDDALRAFPPAIRKCYFEGERKLKFFKTYTKVLCELELYSNMTLQVCGCVIYYPVFPL